MQRNPSFCERNQLRPKICLTSSPHNNSSHNNTLKRSTHEPMYKYTENEKIFFFICVSETGDPNSPLGLEIIRSLTKILMSTRFSFTKVILFLLVSSYFCFYFFYLWAHYNQLLKISFYLFYIYVSITLNYCWIIDFDSKITFTLFYFANR